MGRTNWDIYHVVMMQKLRSKKLRVGFQIEKRFSNQKFKKNQQFFCFF